MFSAFSKIGEKLGIVRPVPVLRNTDHNMLIENSVFHNTQETPNRSLHKIIHQKQKIIDAQEKAIDEMSGENIKFSRIIAALTLSIGVIIGGGVMSVSSQSNPDSLVQKTSSQVAKILGAEKTAHDYVLEEQKNQAILREQKEIVEIYKKLNLAQDELLKAKNTQIELLTSKVELLASDIQGVKASIEKFSQTPAQGTGKITSLVPQNSKTSPMLSQSVSEQVSGFISELNKNASGEFLIKSNTTQEGRVLVWIEGNGKKSLGYYADSPKYTQRLSLEGMQRWANTTIHTLAHIDTVEQIAREKQLSLRKNDATTPFFVQVSQEYSGTLKVLVHDKTLNKTGIFYTLPKDTSLKIHEKFDKVINEFLG